MLQNVFLNWSTFLLCFGFILVDAFVFLVFWFHLDREIAESLSTVTENILQKETFVHLLGLWGNFFIAGTARGACHIMKYKPDHEVVEQGASCSKHGLALTTG